MAAKLSWEERANLVEDNALKSYLLHLIAIKKTNLCVSADVHSTHALLRLADEVGDSICVLKTHADIVDDFGERTIKGLREISRKKRFLIFEDRKFGDIGNTVLAQYTRGPLAIASWAHIVNAHVFPGPAIITSLKAGAAIAIQNLKKCVSTEIFVGTPQLSENEEDDSDDVDEDSEVDDHRTIGGKTRAQSDAERKGVKATTTIYQTFEKPSDRSSLASSGSEPDLLDREALLEKIGDPPLGRALLLFAQMSSEDNLMDEKYARECVKLAHAHKDFVMGFIAQEDLNERDVDNFLSFTPGVKLPPADAAEKNGAHLIKGDGMGQRYNTPAEVVGRRGCDVVIVGRGIVGAKDRRREAERYRREAWKAYEARLE